jgi:peroxiredoxin
MRDAPTRTSGPTRAALALALLLGTSACPSKPTTTPPDAGGEAEEVDDNPIIPAEPANRAEGDELEATIPVVGGESIELASLRGRPVLLEISASWEPGFAEAHELYTKLLAEQPELAVILVVADPADAGLSGLPDQFILAWDPAGALAAKFSVATFPTMFVIDRSGRISAVVNGWSDEVRESLSQAVAEVG